MNIDQLKFNITTILSKPQHFIMAHGGEGQEFITALVSEYSPNYSTTSIEINPTTNRGLSLVPKFYTMLAGMISESGDIDSLASDMAKVINGMGMTEPELAFFLEEALQYHTQANPMRISRTHFSGSSYYNKNNTWFIYLDSNSWYEYKWAMWYVKVWMNDINVSNGEFKFVLNVVKTYRLTHNEDTSIFDQLEQMVADRQLTTVKEGYISNLQWFDGTTLPANYLDIPISDLYEQIKPKIPGLIASANDFIAQTNLLTNLNVIPYSRLFEPGFVDAMFNITNPEFNTKLRAWHQNNLTALERAGIFTANWLI